MKAGITTSVVLHAAILGFGLVSLSTPRAMEMAEIESVPVDIIPFEEISQVIAGDRQAPAAETPAPVPTTRPEPVENAQNVGDNTVDLSTPPTPTPTPREIRAAALPEPSPEPVPDPQPTPEPEVRPEPPRPEPVPATEVQPDPAPRQEVTPDPVAETIVAETPEPAETALPETAPTPQARPQPPQAQTARAPERREAERPAPQREQPRPRQTETQERQFDADEIAALLDRQQPSGGGAQRSEREAALGGQRTNATRLSQSEMDALRQRLAGCWSVPAGVSDTELLKVSVRFRLDRTGRLDGRPEIIRGGSSSGPGRVAGESAVRAVQKCEPFNLPADKYETWSEVVVNFDPTDMLF